MKKAQMTFGDKGQQLFCIEFIIVINNKQITNKQKEFNVILKKIRIPKSAKQFDYKKHKFINKKYIQNKVFDSHQKNIIKQPNLNQISQCNKQSIKLPKQISSNFLKLKQRPKKLIRKRFQYQDYQLCIMNASNNFNYNIKKFPSIKRQRNKSLKAQNYHKNSEESVANSFSKQRVFKWEEQVKKINQDLPLHPQDILKNFSCYLTFYQTTQIVNFKKIYCIGYKSNKKRNGKQNFCYDKQDGTYIFKQHDHILYRFELLNQLGEGSFGQVFKAYDHMKKELIALKMIRNKKKPNNQSLIEIKLLYYIKNHSKNLSTNLINAKEFFKFRNHLCITFDLFSINLYELLKEISFEGFEIELIKRFAIQLLNALNFLFKHGIIHCDIKPQNILLKHPQKSGIKLIDFGSSCFFNKTVYTYIQSRYYRAPQIILGINYTIMIDIWSFACVLAELFLGFPIFPGCDQKQQLSYIIQAIGLPPSQVPFFNMLLDKATRKKYYFNQNGQLLKQLQIKGKQVVPNSRTIRKILHNSNPKFVDFLQACFKWNPEERMTPLQLLGHQWIVENLPQEVKIQHERFLEEENQLVKSMGINSKNLHFLCNQQYCEIFKEQLNCLSYNSSKMKYRYKSNSRWAEKPMCNKKY